MILVSGATGNVGGELLRLLRSEDQPVRALTRDPSKAVLPADVSVVSGNFSSPQSLVEAFSGVQAIFLMMSGQEPEVLRQAVKAGVKRVVLLSSMAVKTRPESFVGKIHSDAEQAVEESGLEWSFLRPGQFATNTRAWAPQISSGDVVRTPYGQVALPAIHPGDIAAVALAALTSDDHVGKSYSLTGPVSVTPVEQVAAIGQAIGRELRHEEIAAEQAAKQMSAHMPAEIVEATLEFLGRPTPAETDALRTVETITGEPARSFTQWANDYAGWFR
ncbi:SDR family oxidoreductase [Rhodococcoides yunnanense]|uniref:NAD(P)H-binding protein n=1 Tax=Rhodococcoides yunnanense TaxID=278209 RepID=A0ABU4BIB5_9NOCA|nr:NAD(P)H-binding protein [Rhodococcus yunnanensis]MDV6263941.1 NAD(P)H-binding protein [Rhodococcus yunnanensis]